MTRDDDADREEDAGDVTPERTALDNALARWTPSTGIAPAVARAQTRRAADLLATTGERLGRTGLADRLADGSTLDAATWWGRAVDPGLEAQVRIARALLDDLDDDADG